MRLIILFICILALFSPLLGCRKPAPPEAPTLDAASSFCADGQFSRARDEIKLLLGKDISPELRAQAVLLDGVILLSMGDFEGAATSLDAITKPTPRLKPEVDYALAKALIFAGRLERAKQLIASIKA